MIDIINVTAGDIKLVDSDVPKAGNVLSIQIGSLEYADEFGIDLAYFLSPDFKFQNSSFQSYLVQQLANNQINVASVIETIEDLFSDYDINISSNQAGNGLIAR